MTPLPLGPQVKFIKAITQAFAPSKAHVSLPSEWGSFAVCPGRLDAAGGYGIRPNRRPGPLVLLSLTACLQAIALTGRADAQITALQGANSTGTTIEPNGGAYQIKDGTSRGLSLFHRLQDFNTTSPGINSVTFLNGSSKHVFMGVINKAVINKPVGLENAANLYILSPSGIQIKEGSRFLNINNLLLTTSSSIKLGTDTFKYNEGAIPVNALTTEPQNSPGKLLSENLGEGRSDSTLFGREPAGAEISIGDNAVLSISKSLIIAAADAQIKITNSILETKGTLVIEGDKSSPRDGLSEGMYIVGRDIAIFQSRLASSGALQIRSPNGSNPGNESFVGNDQLFTTSFKLNSVQLNNVELVSNYNADAFLVYLSSLGDESFVPKGGSQPPSKEFGTNIKRNYEPRFAGPTQKNNLIAYVYGGLDLADVKVVSGFTVNGEPSRILSDSIVVTEVFSTPATYVWYDPCNGCSSTSNTSRVGSLSNFSIYSSDTKNLAAVDIGSYSFTFGKNKDGSDKLFEGGWSYVRDNNQPYVDTSYSPSNIDRLQTVDGQLLNISFGSDAAVYWGSDGAGGANNNLALSFNAGGVFIERLPPGSVNNNINIVSPPAPEGVNNALQTNALNPSNAGSSNTSPNSLFDSLNILVDQNLFEDFESATASGENSKAPLAQDAAASAVDISISALDEESAGDAQDSADTEEDKKKKRKSSN